MKFGIQNILLSSALVLCVLISLGYGAILPSFITACKLNDKECVKASYQNSIPGFMSGIPELGVEVLDPTYLETVEIEDPGLKFKLEDGVYTGWKNTIIDKIDWNTDKKTLDLELHSAFNLSGTYTADGKVVDLPITGHGDMMLKTKDTRFKIHSKYEVVKEKDGKNYIHVTNYTISWQETVGGHYTLTNLFGGNKEKGDAMHHFVNENSKKMINDFGGPIMDVILKKLARNILTFLSKVPIEELTVK